MTSILYSLSPELVALLYAVLLILIVVGSFMLEKIMSAFKPKPVSTEVQVQEQKAGGVGNTEEAVKGAVEAVEAVVDGGDAGGVGGIRSLSVLGRSHVPPHWKRSSAPHPAAVVRQPPPVQRLVAGHQSWETLHPHAGSVGLAPGAATAVAFGCDAEAGSGSVV